MDPLQQSNNSQIGITSTEAVNSLMKGFITLSRLSTSFHKDKTIATDSFKQTKDARQIASTHNLARDKTVRQWFLEGSFSSTGRVV